MRKVKKRMWKRPKHLVRGYSRIRDGRREWVSGHLRRNRRAWKLKKYRSKWW